MKRSRPAQTVAMLLSCVSIAAAYGQSATAQPSEIMPEAIKWMSTPTLPGVQLAWLTGGADQAGLYELRVHLAAGATVPPHAHPDTRCATVLSGDLYAGRGNAGEPQNAKRYPAGSFHCVPAGVVHYVVAKDGEVVFQDSGVGPTGTDWIKKP